ncbi:MAG: hypothetical protein QM811_00520 [Pirellulales bacterium]
MSTVADTPVAAPLAELTDHLEKQPDYSAAIASLIQGHGATFGGVWGSSCALLLADLVRRVPGRVLAILAHPDHVDSLTADFRLFSDASVEVFPPWESSGDEMSLSDEIHGERLRLLKNLRADKAAKLIVAGASALLQPVPTQAYLVERTRRIAVGESLNVPELCAWLVENGFSATTAVRLPGEFSQRGGILDLYAPDWENPLRVELFDDQVESIRSFEVATQRSLGQQNELDLSLIHPYRTDRGFLSEYLPADSWVVLIEPAEINEEVRFYLQRVERPQDFHEWDDVQQRLFQFPSITASSIAGGSFEATCELRIESVERFSGDIDKVRGELDQAGEGQRVFLICPTPAEVDRYTELFAGTRLATEGRLRLLAGHLRSGFRLVSERLALVSSNELFHRSDIAVSNKRRLGRAIDSFLDLREGDYVVHLGHGIGRFRGLKLMETVCKPKSISNSSSTAARKSSSPRPISNSSKNTSAAAKAARRWAKSAARRG